MAHHLMPLSRPRPAFAADAKIVLPWWQQALFDLTNAVLAMLGKPPIYIIQDE